MRKFAVVLLVIGFAQTSAFGGLITFSPDKPTVDLVAGDSPLVKFDVFIDQLVGVNDGFQSFDVVFGSNDLELVSFDIAQSILDVAFVSGVDLAPGLGFYADEIKAGAFALSPISVTGPTALGSLVVDVSAVLATGTYEVIVDSDIDSQRSFVSNSGANDFLFGLGSVNVIVPEPATISLLGLASLALIRRRRKA